MARYFKCLTDKNPVSYVCGQEITFTVFAREDGKNIDCERLFWQMETDDGFKNSGMAAIGKDTPLTVKVRLQRPGFAHLQCEAQHNNGEAQENFDRLDASAGADVDQIVYSDTLPEDFGAYWNEIEQTVANTDLEILECIERKNHIREGFLAYDVKIKTPAGKPASGCITVPKRDGKFPIRISFLGYGIHGAYCEYFDGMISACFNAHGFENDKPDSELEKIYGKELSWYGFDAAQNASNQTTYFRNMMIRNLIGLKFVKTLPEWNGKEILATGGSQGALQAVTVAAHDKGVTRLEIYKPWLCDLKSVNEGYLGGWRPDFAEGLRYFDTVAQGMLVQCPTKVECYLGDYVCPPKTVMALYNSLSCQKEIKFFQSTTHSYTPPEKEEVTD